MSHAPFTEAEVDYLLKARKVIHGVIKDSTQKPDAALLEIVFRVRRLDRPSDDIRLKLSARRPKSVMATANQRPRPSAALLWHGKRIRGIDRKIVHYIIKNGAIIGRVRGWHEHRWTEADDDDFVVDVNKAMRNVHEDVGSILRFCMKRWNVEVRDDDRQLILL